MRIPVDGEEYEVSLEDYFAAQFDKMAEESRADRQKLADILADISAVVKELAAVAVKPVEVDVKQDVSAMAQISEKLRDVAIELAKPVRHDRIKVDVPVPEAIKGFKIRSVGHSSNGAITSAVIDLVRA